MVAFAIPFRLIVRDSGFSSVVVQLIVIAEEPSHKVVNVVFGVRVMAGNPRGLTRQ